MTTEAQVPDGHPLRIEWDRYKETEEYANALRWAEKEPYRSGSMWAAFAAGWYARGIVDARRGE